jgi:DNA-binding NarL/FixJ family response regulator
MTAPVRVLLTDGQPLVREGMGLLLGLLPGVELVATASDAGEALALAARTRPDIVLMELSGSRHDGVGIIRRLTETHPGMNVIVLTTSMDDDSVIDALQAGARGYLTKDCGAAAMRHALLQVAAGRMMIDPAVQRHLAATMTTMATTTASAAGRRPARLPDFLTPRESEILALVAEGLSNIDIATHLVLSEATVKTHVHQILDKIGGGDRTEAAGHAYPRGPATAGDDQRTRPT